MKFFFSKINKTFQFFANSSNFFKLLFCRDYETRPRVWIAAILIGANFLISLTYAFLAVFQQILMKSIFIVCLAVAVVSIILLEIIYFLNRKRLDSLIRHDNTMVLYTLSIKYQLQENVRSCRVSWAPPI